MAGVFYACYELSRRSWYCLPTIRNTAGIDIVAYSLDNSRRRITIQVRSLSKRNPVPMRKTPVPYDHLIIVRKVHGEKRDTVLARAEGLRVLQG